MLRIGILSASNALMVALIACVPGGTSDMRRDESLLAIPVPSPGLSVRAEREFWQVVSGTHSVIDNQASVLLKRRDGVGDVFISSPPMVSVGTTVYAYHAYVTSIGNRTLSEITTYEDKLRKMSAFRYDDRRDNVLCLNNVVIIEFGASFTEKVLFRGSWKKDDDVGDKAVQDVLWSIRPQTVD